LHGAASPSFTAAPDGEPAGLIINSLTSVSLQPPLLSFCPSRHSLTWSRMRRARRFGVNVLRWQHERFAIRATPASADRFDGLDWELGLGGVPLLTDALATLECEIVAEHPAGDHWIVVGRVDHLRVSPISDPLVFFAGAYRTPVTVRGRPQHGHTMVFPSHERGRSAVSVEPERLFEEVRRVPRDADVVAYYRGSYCAFAGEAVRPSGPTASAPAGSRTAFRSGADRVSR
jgi:3-hydroxy-9,10-secoandrosta-1,3,5(10)-triene-9,17-dione monooxygenase reductase component